MAQKQDDKKYTGLYEQNKGNSCCAPLFTHSVGRLREEVLDMVGVAEDGSPPGSHAAVQAAVS